MASAQTLGLITRLTAKLFYDARLYSSQVQVKIFAPKASGQRIGRIAAIETLESLLKIRRFKAIDLVTQGKELSTIPVDIITSNYKILTDHKVRSTLLIKYPDIMAARDPTALSQNIEELKTLPYKLNETAYLAVFERDKFKKVLKKQDLLAKIDLLVRKLETTVDVVIEGFVKRSFLLTVSVHRMEELIDLLKNNNVTSQDIVKDWWVLQYSPKLVKERLEVSKANNINPIKTWMVRCTADILQRYIQRRSENKLVLGESTTQEYLSERLQCSQQEANYLILKLPALEKKSMKKMKEIIDFLYAEGFKPYHIYRVPKILLHSVQTTKKRIRELEKQGVQIDSLHILIKSQKQYMQYYQALVKSNINKVRMDEQAG